MNLIENRTVDEIKIGDKADLDRVLTRQDIVLFATASADVNPVDVDSDDEEASGLKQGIAHGMWAGALISAILSTRLPGPGTVHLGQTLKFHQPVGIGDRITVRVEVTGVDTSSGHVALDCVCVNADGVTVVSGTAEVRAPREKVKRPVARMPSARLHAQGVRFGAMVERARSADHRHRPPLRRSQPGRGDRGA